MMSELALVNDRLENFSIATGLMQHLMADGGAVPLSINPLPTISSLSPNNINPRMCSNSHIDYAPYISEM